MGEYDPAQELIIDPLLASTFLGGSGDEYGVVVVPDGNGHVYVSGETTSSEFPATIGAFAGTYIGGAADAYISKFDETLTTLLASTFIGGSGFDSGGSLILDGIGHVYFTGVTSSSDYPVTPGAFDETYNGGAYDAVISKLDADLSSLLASTFLGAAGNDFGHEMVFDGDGNLYLTGETTSFSFPTTPGASDESYNGGSDPYVTKFDADLTAVLASTFLGGTNDDGGNAMCRDVDGNIFLTGYTRSANYPTTTGAYDETYNGGEFDGFISKLDPDLTQLSASTLFGGLHMDYSYSMVAIADGSVLITGWTYSYNFPTTPGAYDESPNGGSDVFVIKLDNPLAALLGSTVVGSGLDDGGCEITVDAGGSVYLAGLSDSPNYPVTPGAYDEDHNGGTDICVSKLDGNLSTLLASTFLGGSDEDMALGMALDSDGEVYVTGTTKSVAYTTTPGAFDPNHNGGRDIFVSALDAGLSASLAAVHDWDPPTHPVWCAHHPNPCRGGMTLEYRLEQGSSVCVEIYDPSGRRIRILVDGYQSAGLQSVEWDGTDSSGQSVSSGMYSFRIRTESGVQHIRTAFMR